MSYKIEIVEQKDLIVQFEASKLSIKDLFNNLLNETKGFKYQITVKVLLKKYKHDGEIAYFNSLAKIVIRHKFNLGNAFQEIFYMTDVWINEDLAELLNQSHLNILAFQLIDHYQEVLT